MVTSRNSKDEHLTPSNSPLVPIPAIAGVPKTIVITPTISTNSAFLTAFRSLAEHPLETQRPLADAICWSRTPTIGVVGPVLGRPAVETALHPLLHSGAKRLIVFGTAAGICDSHRKWRIGDVALADAARCDNGVLVTSRHTDYGQQADKTLFQLLSCSMKNELQAKGVTTWTTDAPYAENAEKIRSAQQQAAQLIEMEFASVARLANHYGAASVGIFVISDIFDAAWTSGFTSKALKTRLRQTALLLAASLLETD